MTTPKPIGTPSAPDAYEPLSTAEKIEENASLVGLAAADALRAVDVAAVVLIGLLVCPPLAILVVVVVVPLLVTALVLGLLAAVLLTPYLLVHHFRGHHGGHGALFMDRLRGAGRALLDLAPHRIVADARKLDAGRWPAWPPPRSASCGPRGDGATQPTTTVELFFDLVYVFAVTQLSHQIFDDLSVAGVARAAFLLLIVWWAWIYTTWMANWFDPASSAVRGVLTAVMLGSLLMAAALPEAFGERGLLFAGSYAFVETAALWWLYFGATAEHARLTMSTSDDPGRLARDAYT
jgi:hypothetical protein